MVFSRKRLGSSSYSVYFRVALIFESILLAQSFRYWAQFFLGFDLDLTCVFFCKINDFVTSVAGLASNWLLTITLFDRFLTIIYHNRLKILKNRRFQAGVVFIVILYCIAISSYKIFTIYLEKDITPGNMSSQILNVSKCIRPRHLYKLQKIVFFSNILLNSLINLVLYVRLISFISKIRKRVKASRRWRYY